MRVRARLRSVHCYIKKVMEGRGRSRKALKDRVGPNKVMEGHGRSWKVMEGHEAK